MKHKMSETPKEKLMQPEELKALTKESYEEGYKELVRLLNLEFKKAATSGNSMITITIPPQKMVFRLLMLRQVKRKQSFLQNLCLDLIL